MESGIGVDNVNLSKFSIIDIKGTLSLAATIIAFLAGITLLEGNSDGAVYQVAGLFVVSGVSLTVFIVIEKALICLCLTSS